MGVLSESIGCMRWHDSKTSEFGRCFIEIAGNIASFSESTGCMRWNYGKISDFGGEWPEKRKIFSELVEKTEYEMCRSTAKHKKKKKPTTPPKGSALLLHETFRDGTNLGLRYPTITLKIRKGILFAIHYITVTLKIPGGNDFCDALHSGYFKNFIDLSMGLLEGPFSAMAGMP